MFDNKGIGQLLRKLRIENNYTQDELANKLFLTRQAISRWENSKSIPDYETLLSLSKLYNISVDEILYGKEMNKSKIIKLFLSTINEKNKILKFRNTLFILLIIFIIIFSLYFFITTFNKINIFSINGGNEKIICNDSLIIITVDKVYFKTCDFNLINDNNEEYIDNIKYYYLDNNNEKLIISSGPSVKLIKDLRTAPKYFDYSNFNRISKNMYVEVNTNLNKYNIKLNIVKTYSNSNIVNPFDNRKI